jgi:sterol O-acyltransferase
MTSIDVLANGHSHFDSYADNVLRARIHKPLHAQVSRASSTDGDNHLLGLPTGDSNGSVGSATTR